MSELKIVQRHLDHLRSYLDWPGTNQKLLDEMSAMARTLQLMQLCWITNLSLQTSRLDLVFPCYPFTFCEQSRKAVRWVRLLTHPCTDRRLDYRPGDNSFSRHLFLCFGLLLILFPSSRFFWRCKSEIGKDVLTVAVVLVLRIWYTDICQLVHWGGHRTKHSSVWPVRIRQNTFLPIENTECVRTYLTQPTHKLRDFESLPCTE